MRLTLKKMPVDRQIMHNSRKAPAVAVTAAAVFCIIATVIFLIRKGDGSYDRVIGYVLCILLTASVLLTGRIVYGSETVNRRRGGAIALLLLLLGLAFGILIPPLAGPDEVNHYATAYRWSLVLTGDMEINEQPVREEIGYVCYDTPYRTCDADLIENFLSEEASEKKNILRLAYGDASLLADKLPDETVQLSVNSYPYTPLGYIPAIVGITVGRLFGLGAVSTALLARFLGLAVCVLLFDRSFKNMKRGKEAVLVLVLFPMTLHLISAITPDGLMVCLSVYAFSRFTEMLEGEKQAAWSEEAAFLAALFSATLIKLYCFSLCMLPLFLPVTKFPEKRKKYYYCTVSILTAFTALFLGNLNAITGVLNGTAVAYMGSAWTLSDVLARPGFFAALFLKSIVLDLPMIACTLPGYSLGAFSIQLPHYLFSAAYLALAVAASFSVTGEENRKKLLWMIPVALMALFPAYGCMLLWWTPKGSERILGVQGRYFLPVMPLALTALSSFGIYKNGKIRSRMVPTAASLDLIVCVYIFAALL